MKGFYRQLAKHQKPTGFSHSSEMQFYLDNCGLLSTIPSFRHFLKSSDPFSVIQANILIKSILNKMALEEVLDQKIRSKFDPDETQKAYQSKLAALPQFEDEGTLVTIPIFSRPMNRIYASGGDKLLHKPYSIMRKNFDTAIVDPFDEYGINLFKSNFTNLVCWGENGNVAAFFHRPSMSVFFVNEQGCLEARIALFDRYINHQNYENLQARCNGFIQAFFDYDLDKCITELVDNRLISSRLMKKIFTD